MSFLLQQNSSGPAIVAMFLGVKVHPRRITTYSEKMNHNSFTVSQVFQNNIEVKKTDQ